MKTYIGERRASGPCVFVRDGAVERPLRHHPLHSPSGFEWGYAGSGPAELARCILLEHFGEKAACLTCGGGHSATSAEPSKSCWSCSGSGVRLPVSFQAFKARFIAPLPALGPWQISEEEIEAWVRRELGAGG